MTTWKDGSAATLGAAASSSGQRPISLSLFWRDGLVFASLGGALALYYFPDNLLLTSVGALAFVALAWLRLDMSLVWALFVVPFYRYPKVIAPDFMGALGLERAESLEFSLFEFAILACGLAWLMRQVVRRQGWTAPRPSWRSLLHPAVALLVVASLSLLVSQYLRFSLREYRIVVVEPLLFYFLLRQTYNSHDKVARMLDAFVLGGAILSIVSLYHYFFIGMVEATGGVDRLLAIYHSPNALGLFLGRLAPLAVALVLVDKRQGWARSLYGVGALLILASLVLTFSRGAWIGVGTALAFVVVMRFGWRGVVAFAAIGLIALVVMLVRPQGRLLSEATNLQRWYIWQSASTMIGDNPLFGVGLDNFLYHYPDYILPEAWAEPNISHPHNIILDFWLRLGLLGVGVIFWLQFRFWRLGVKVWRAASGGTTGALAVGLMAVMIDFLVHGFIDNSFFLVDLAVVFWLIFGLMEALARRDSSTAVEVAM